MAAEEIIHKITLDPTGDQTVEVPVTARFVAVDRDPRDERAVAVWYRRSTSPQYSRPVRLSVIGTGHLFPTEASYLGSVVMPPFVWHVLCYED